MKSKYIIMYVLLMASICHQGVYAEDNLNKTPPSVTGNPDPQIESASDRLDKALISIESGEFADAGETLSNTRANLSNTIWEEVDRRHRIRIYLKWIELGQKLGFRWAQHDLKEVLQWTDSLDRKDLKDFKNRIFVGIGEAWGHHGAQEALNWASTLQDEGYRPMVYGHITGAWAATDKRAVMAWVEPYLRQHPNQPIILGDFVKAFTYVWAKNDHEAAQVWVEEQLRSLEDQIPANQGESSNLKRYEGNLLYGVARGWLEKDIESACDWVIKMAGKKYECFSAAYAIGVHKLDHDPLEAGRWHDRLSEVDAKCDNLCEPIARAIAQLDVQKAVAWAAARQGPNARRKAFKGVVHVITKIERMDLNTAVALVQALGNNQKVAVDSLLWNWGEHDPVAVAYYLSDNRADGRYWWAAHRFAKHDPDLAAKWVLTVSNGWHRRQALSGLVDHWAENDFEEALAWAHQLESPMNKGPAMAVILTFCAKTDLERAFKEAKMIEHRNWRRYVIMEMLEYRFFKGRKEKNEKLLEWAIQFKDPTDRLDAISGVASVWSEWDDDGDRESVHQALKWVESVTDDEGAIYVQDSMVRLMSTHNCTLASKILNSVGLDGQHEALYAHLAKNWASRRASAAAKWAIELNPKRQPRLATIQIIYEVWRGRDFDAARAWLEGLNISDQRAIQDSLDASTGYSDL